MGVSLQDYPGLVPDAEQLADRLAILNLLGRYGTYPNEADYVGTLRMFADDAIFEIGGPDGFVPVDKAVLQATERNIFTLYEERLADPTKGERRIYFLTNLHVREQTATTADVSMMIVLVCNQPTGPMPYVETTGIFTGTLVKRDGCWLIHRWRVRLDRANDPFLGESARFSTAWEK